MSIESIIKDATENWTNAIKEHQQKKSNAEIIVNKLMGAIEAAQYIANMLEQEKAKSEVVEPEVQ